jgi:hypothetical protein
MCFFSVKTTTEFAGWPSEDPPIGNKIDLKSLLASTSTASTTETSETTTPGTNAMIWEIFFLFFRFKVCMYFYTWHYVAISNSKFPNAKFLTVTLPNFKSLNGHIFKL